MLIAQCSSLSSPTKPCCSSGTSKVRHLRPFDLALFQIVQSSIDTYWVFRHYISSVLTPSHYDKITFKRQRILIGFSGARVWVCNGCMYSRHWVPCWSPSAFNKNVLKKWCQQAACERFVPIQNTIYESMNSSQLCGGWFELKPFTPAITQAMPHLRSDLSMKARRDFGMTTELIKANDIIINLCRIWKNYLLRKPPSRDKPPKKISSRDISSVFSRSTWLTHPFGGPPHWTRLRNCWRYTPFITAISPVGHFFQILWDTDGYIIRIQAWWNIMGVYYDLIWIIIGISPYGVISSMAGRSPGQTEVYFARKIIELDSRCFFFQPAMFDLL